MWVTKKFVGSGRLKKIICNPWTQAFLLVSGLALAGSDSQTIWPWNCLAGALPLGLLLLISIRMRAPDDYKDDFKLFVERELADYDQFFFHRGLSPEYENGKEEFASDTPCLYCGHAMVFRGFRRRNVPILDARYFGVCVFCGHWKEY